MGRTVFMCLVVAWLFGCDNNEPNPSDSPDVVSPDGGQDSLVQPLDATDLASEPDQPGVQDDALETGGDLLTDGTANVPDLEPPVETWSLDVLYSPSDAADLGFDLGSVTVSLGTGDNLCSEFNPSAPWDEGLVGQKTGGSLSMVPQFEDLGLDQTYWLTVLVFAGTGNEAHLAAYGCLEGLKAADFTTDPAEATVLLSLVQLLPDGLYDFTQDLFLEETPVAETLSAVLESLSTVWSDDSAALRELVVASVQAEVAPGTTDEVMASFTEALASAIATTVANNTDAFQELLAEPDSLLEAMQHVRWQGVLALAAQENGVVFHVTWDSTTFWWDGACSPGEADCGEWVFSTADLEELGPAIGDSEWVGSLGDQGRLLVEPYAMNHNVFRGGRLLLDKAVVPSLTGQPDLGSYLAEQVDCSEVAAALPSGVLTDVGLTPEQFLNICQQAHDDVVTQAMSGWGSVYLAATVHLQGECVATDLDGDAEDGDLVVDALEDGELSGFSLDSSQVEVGITGTFYATRIP